MKNPALTLVLMMIFITCCQKINAQTLDAYEIKFRNSFGGDDSDPYRLRKVNASGNNNWLELQLNDDGDESLRIYGSSCAGYGCGEYSGNLYHLFDTGGKAFHAGNVGIGTLAPAARLHVYEGALSGAQGLNGATKFAIDAPGGGFSEIRTSTDNNTWGGLLFSDNNLGGYVAFRNYPDDRLHLGAYGGIAFEVGIENGVGSKTERMRIDNAGNVGIGTPTPSSKLMVVGAQSAEENVLNVTNLIDQDFTVRLSPPGAAVKRTILATSTVNRFSLGVGSSNEHLTVINGGNVGIGTTSPTQKLTVNGTIYGKQVKVDLSVPGPDYVFEKSYSLPTLDQVGAYIDKNKHLPEVPSAKEMEASGINVGEMNMLLLKKVEELTLYMIEMKDTIKKQQDEIEKIKGLHQLGNASDLEKKLK